MVGIKENIIRARQEKGFSQADLACKTKKLSQSQIAKIEKGNRRILVTDLICIANALDVKVDNLLTEKE